MTGSALPIVLFEPAAASALGPPADHRPVWSIRVGALCLEERLAALGCEVLGGVARPELRGLVPAPDLAAVDADALLLIAGDLLLLEPGQRERCFGLAVGERIETEGRLLAACLPRGEAASLLADLSWGGEPAAAVERGELGAVVTRWWEIFEFAGGALNADLPLLLARGDWRGAERDDWPDRERIRLAADAAVAPGAVLDASGGPVLLDAGVSIGANSFVQGPCYLGPGTRVKPGSQLLHGCYAGPECRLGGEIEETQFQGYANKQHHGFLGHAAVGEWVNLGAGVTNSDLKNNYSPVRVEQGGRELQSQRRFLGCCLGDHVKVGIQGRINTGTVLEPFTNWFGADFPPKGLPAFLWGSDRQLAPYFLDKALETAAQVMERRGQTLTDAMARTVAALFESTESSRAALGS